MGFLCPSFCSIKETVHSFVYLEFGSELELCLGFQICLFSINAAVTLQIMQCQVNKF